MQCLGAPVTWFCVSASSRAQPLSSSSSNWTSTFPMKTTEIYWHHLSLCIHLSFLSQLPCTIWAVGKKSKICMIRQQLKVLLIPEPPSSPSKSPSCVKRNTHPRKTSTLKWSRYCHIRHKDEIKRLNDMSVREPEVLG